ncbi:hypothetical protein HK102_007615 [Quaeritorhiza haematococci]|nr:hypothetical protein HK102_007615 [Quaeritorhiza haematococci]
MTSTTAIPTESATATSNNRNNSEIQDIPDATSASGSSHSSPSTYTNHGWNFGGNSVGDRLGLALFGSGGSDGTAFAAPQAGEGDLIHKQPRRFRDNARPPTASVPIVIPVGTSASTNPTTSTNHLISGAQGHRHHLFESASGVLTDVVLSRSNPQKQHQLSQQQQQHETQLQSTQNPKPSDENAYGHLHSLSHRFHVHAPLADTQQLPHTGSNPSSINHTIAIDGDSAIELNANEILSTRRHQQHRLSKPSLPSTSESKRNWSSSNFSASMTTVGSHSTPTSMQVPVVICRSSGDQAFNNRYEYPGDGQIEDTSGSTLHSSQNGSFLANVGPRYWNWDGPAGGTGRAQRTGGSQAFSSSRQLNGLSTNAPTNVSSKTTSSTSSSIGGSHNYQQYHHPHEFPPRMQGNQYLAQQAALSLSASNSNSSYVSSGFRKSNNHNRGAINSGGGKRLSVGTDVTNLAGTSTVGNGFGNVEYVPSTNIVKTKFIIPVDNGYNSSFSGGIESSRHHQFSNTFSYDSNNGGNTAVSVLGNRRSLKVNSQRQHVGSEFWNGSYNNIMNINDYAANGATGATSYEGGGNNNHHNAAPVSAYESMSNSSHYPPTAARTTLSTGQYANVSLQPRNRNTIQHFQRGGVTVEYLPPLLFCYSCSLEKPVDCFSRSQVRKAAGGGPRHRPTCKACTPTQTTHLTCTMCERRLELSCFSKAQRRMGDLARCLVCVAMRDEDDEEEEEDEGEGAIGGYRSAPHGNGAFEIPPRHASVNNDNGMVRFHHQAYSGGGMCSGQLDRTAQDVRERLARSNNENGNIGNKKTKTNGGGKSIVNRWKGWFDDEDIGPVSIDFDDDD